MNWTVRGTYISRVEDIAIFFEGGPKCGAAMAALITPMVLALKSKGHHDIQPSFQGSESHDLFMNTAQQHWVNFKSAAQCQCRALSWSTSCLWAGAMANYCTKMRLGSSNKFYTLGHFLSFCLTTIQWQFFTLGINWQNLPGMRFTVGMNYQEVHCFKDGSM